MHAERKKKLWRVRLGPKELEERLLGTCSEKLDEGEEEKRFRAGDIDEGVKIVGRMYIWVIAIRESVRIGGEESE